MTIEAARTPAPRARLAEASNKITLTRKQTSEIKKSDSTGRARTIQVEVRKKRVFVKRDPSEAPPDTAAAPAAAVPEPAPVIDAREAALRDEEIKRQRQLAELQAAELRERQEREKREAEQKAAEREAQAALEKAQASAQPAAAGVAPGADSTLHKPKLAPGEKTDKKPKKKEVTVWKDESTKRRTIKTRGDVAGGAGGWHSPRGGHHRRTAAPGGEAVAARRARRSCERSQCRKRSPWASWPTRCLSRRPKSSRP